MPFPIQAATLPDALAGHDILGRAQTGSGKTLGFCLPLAARPADAYTLAWLTACDQICFSDLDVAPAYPQSLGDGTGAPTTSRRTRSQNARTLVATGSVSVPSTL